VDGRIFSTLFTMHQSDRYEPKFARLTARLAEISDIEAAISLLNWDRATYMPPGAAAARGQQLATLEQIAHQKFTDLTIAQLLEDLRPYEKSLPPNSREARLLRVTRRDYERAIRVPSRFLARFSACQTEGYAAWVRAKSESNFSLVRSHLERMLDLCRERASFFPEFESVADPLIDIYDPGMTVKTIRPLFSQLRDRLVPMVNAIADSTPINDSFLQQSFGQEQQLNFCHKVLERIGYNYDRGRSDLSPHPFTSSPSVDDVRVTTRVYPNPTQAIFSSLHEMGHALYEQNIDRALMRSPLGTGTSSGMHEAQARFWENIIGRSRAFWECFFPWLQGMFLRELNQVVVADFYRAINKVERSLVRTDADELTYNLHAIVRFDLEVAMLEGKIAIADLPEAWNERYRQDLGIVPPDDRLGVLQDVHWYGFGIGGLFQGYTLGNLIAAQLYESLLKTNPGISVDIEQGHFQPLLEWLRKNIYRHGRKFSTSELLQQVTGKPLHIDPFVSYIEEKYTALYSTNSQSF